MQKSFSQGPEMEKRKSISRQKISKKPSGHAKSSWEIFGAKVFAKKCLLFLWKLEKTTKILFVFQFLLLSKLILWTHRMHLSQFYPRLLEVGLVIRACFFFNRKTKKFRSSFANFEKVLNIFRKKHLRKKCPIEMQIRQPRWKFLAKKLMNFSSKYRSQ